MTESNPAEVEPEDEDLPEDGDPEGEDAIDGPPPEPAPDQPQEPVDA